MWLNGMWLNGMWLNGKRFTGITSFIDIHFDVIEKSGRDLSSRIDCQSTFDSVARSTNGGCYGRTDSTQYTNRLFTIPVGLALNIQHLQINVIGMLDELWGHHDITIPSRRPTTVVPGTALKSRSFRANWFFSTASFGECSYDCPYDLTFQIDVGHF